MVVVVGERKRGEKKGLGQEEREMCGCLAEESAIFCGCKMTYLMWVYVCMRVCGLLMLDGHRRRRGMKQAVACEDTTATMRKGARAFGLLSAYVGKKGGVYVGECRCGFGFWFLSCVSFSEESGVSFHFCL